MVSWLVCSGCRQYLFIDGGGASRGWGWRPPCSLANPSPVPAPPPAPAVVGRGARAVHPPGDVTRDVLRGCSRGRQGSSVACLCTVNVNDQAQRVTRLIAESTDLGRGTSTDMRDQGIAGRFTSFQPCHVHQCTEQRRGLVRVAHRNLASHDLAYQPRSTSSSVWSQVLSFKPCPNLRQSRARSSSRCHRRRASSSPRLPTFPPRLPSSS